MTGIAGVVITRNEASHIAACLKSLSFCDEIVVVDSGSTDQTTQIAKAYTDKVVTREWKGYADQKNFATALTNKPWILSIDADERVSDELREEIKQRLDDADSPAAFQMPRKTIHSGRWIRHGGWYPNRLVRLFRKDKGQWSDAEVHEAWVTEGSVGDLQGHLIHYSFENFSDQVARNNHYSTLAAQRLFRMGQPFRMLKLLFKPVSKFVELYFLKRGFLDGYPGFIIAVSAAYSVFLKWAKLWELERGQETQKED